ncbi:MAG: putative DNA binding domain-containing protein [Flavobacterium sp.]|nr:putative DNA binding domain-containing protein [Flavobacterium sp.]
MEEQQIKQIISLGEGKQIEFKSAKQSVPSDLYETIVSFSNTEGGTLLLGIEDDGTVSGIKEEFKNKILKDLVSSINSPDCINPPLYLQPVPVKVDGVWIIAMQVPVSSQVHDHKKEIYIREYESDLNITDQRQRVSDLHLNKRNYFTESQVIPNLSMEDLDTNLFEKARNLIKSNQSDHPWLFENDKKMLEEASLYRKDFFTQKEGLTFAAALIFGKDSTIQSLFPAYKVEGMVRKINVDRWDDRINPPLRTNLIDTYTELKGFVNKHLREKFYMEGDQRVDLRDKVFREVIGNVIVHREYSSALATELIIDKNQLTITNPNNPHFSGPIDLNSFNPYPKNPNIRKFFTALGWTDEIGSGIRNTKKYLPLYIEGAQPIFIEGPIFKTIIPLRLSTLKPFTNKWLKWLELDEKYSTHLEISLSKFNVDSELFDATWEECLLNLVPSWSQKGTKLESLDWPKNQPIDKEEIKKVPSWSLKSTNLIHKKIRYIIAILSLVAEPLSLDDIMNAVGYTNKKTFRDNYLKPLEQLQWIEKTNPKNPTAPDQKYRLTISGKMFLGNQE